MSMAAGAIVPPPMKAIVVLASQSSNRLKLLRQIGIDPIVRVSNFEENLSKSLPVREFVEKTAYGKLVAVVDDLKREGQQFDAIVACDTVIYVDNEIIGKPKDAEEATSVLQNLRNRSHLVYSGVAIGYPDGSEEVFSEETKVEFGDYSDKTIDQYVATGEPLLKAGSYGIQEFGAVFVKGIEGCFSNIVGLPLHQLHRRLSLKSLL